MNNNNQGFEKQPDGTITTAGNSWEHEFKQRFPALDYFDATPTGGNHEDAQQEVIDYVAELIESAKAQGYEEGRNDANKHNLSQWVADRTKYTEEGKAEARKELIEFMEKEKASWLEGNYHTNIAGGAASALTSAITHLNNLK